MGYWTRTVGGLLLIAAGLGVFGYSLAELIEGGTCSSGGPYVSSRPCPENTALYIVLLFPSVIAFLAGGAMFVGRGRRSVKPGLPPQGGSVTANPPSFGSAGLVSSEGPSLLEGMAAIRDAAVKQSLGRTDSAARPPPPAPAPPPPSNGVSATSAAIAADPLQDPVVRLEKLVELRRAGLVSEPEFEAQKKRILKEI